MGISDISNLRSMKVTKITEYDKENSCSIALKLMRNAKHFT